MKDAGLITDLLSFLQVVCGICAFAKPAGGKQLQRSLYVLPGCSAQQPRPLLRDEAFTFWMSQ